MPAAVGVDIALCEPVNQWSAGERLAQLLLLARPALECDRERDVGRGRPAKFGRGRGEGGG